MGVIDPLAIPAISYTLENLSDGLLPSSVTETKNLVKSVGKSIFKDGDFKKAGEQLKHGIKKTSTKKTPTVNEPEVEAPKPTVDEPEVETPHTFTPSEVDEMNKYGEQYSWMNDDDDEEIYKTLDNLRSSYNDLQDQSNILTNTLEKGGNYSNENASDFAKANDSFNEANKSVDNVLAENTGKEVAENTGKEVVEETAEKTASKALIDGGIDEATVGAYNPINDVIGLAMGVGGLILGELGFNRQKQHPFNYTPLNPSTQFGV